MGLLAQQVILINLQLTKQKKNLLTSTNLTYESWLTFLMAYLNYTSIENSLQLKR
jgi:hypothetical protein